MESTHDLGLIIDSQVPIIRLESHEESRALELLQRVARKRHLPIYAWSITEGLQSLGFSEKLRLESEAEVDPVDVLKQIKANNEASIYILCDFHPYLEGQALHIRLLKDIALNHAEVHHTVVLLSHAIELPVELKRFSAFLRLSLPSEKQLLHIVKEEALRWAKQNKNTKVRTDNKVLRKMIANMRGLTHSEARRLIRGAIFDDGAITESDLLVVNKAKFQLLDVDSVLSFEYDTEKFQDVGGLNGLKDWLADRHSAFLNADLQDRPKGLLLLGVQGAGKSLSAKAVAGLWGLPLLRLDIGALYNKFIGETERNMREALQLADLMEPCVLWIDEIEKGIGDGGDNEGTSRRILATFLTWLAERQSKVFVVATANDIKRLPPELLRKGRLDEIFFVDLPSEEVRKQIFEIHLKKRDMDVEDFDLQDLAETAEGFSGAEIEQAVVAAMYRSSAQQTELADEHILHEVTNTYPLSVTMAEDIEALRIWAADRAVPAD